MAPISQPFSSLPALAALAAVRRHARPLADTAPAYAPLLDLLSRMRFALLGEASHGTHEFLRERAEITKRLIAQHNYSAVVVEADWPDAYRVNRYVRGLPEDLDAKAALSGFNRFPAWLWRNTVVLEFVEWLRAYNDARPPWQRVGFYGMDQYGLFGSIREMLDYMDHADPYAAQRARLRYACFDHFQQNIQAYGYAAGFGTGFSCEDEVVAQLLEINRGSLATGDTPLDDPDALFQAQQNGLLVSNAEHYYRSLFKGRISSWNLRENHMADTLQAINGHLAKRSGLPPRIAVWTHNSHVGDASATAMNGRGEWNVGELMRQRYPGETALVGFTAYKGSVVAASDWDSPGQSKRLRPALSGSWEALFHETGLDRFLLMLRGNEALSQALKEPLLQRAIGVIYAPESERQSHFLEACLPAQFDAVIHIDETREVDPLDAWTGNSSLANAKAKAPEMHLWSG